MQDAWDLTAPNAEQQEADDTEEGCLQSKLYSALNPGNNPVFTRSDIGQGLGIPTTDAQEEDIVHHEMADGDYRVLMLNKAQMEFVYDTLHHLKTRDSPTYCFLTGDAGLDKLRVTTALYQSLLKYYNHQAGTDFHRIFVLLLAPTGKAAHNIHGNTIHSALKIPINQSLKHKSLDSDRLNTLRTQLRGIRVVFIDEISMLANALFSFINCRLREITGSPLPFGGISIVCVGDLFQLKSVCDSYIFLNLSKDYGPLAINL